MVKIKAFNQVCGVQFQEADTEARTVDMLKGDGVHFALGNTYCIKGPAFLQKQVKKR